VKHSMKKFLGTTGGKVCIICAAVLLLAGALCAYQGYQYYQLPKFQNVTIELGQEMPSLSEFLTEHADPEKARFLTDDVQIDLSVEGEHTLCFLHGRKQETVTLTVVDTTPPQVEFRDVVADIKESLQPEDFVVQAQDLSPITVSFAEPLAQPEDYGSKTVEIVVTDACGNATIGQCQVNFVWMREAVTLELGDTLTKLDLLLSIRKDADLVDQAELDRINSSPVGTYTITSTDGGRTCTCTVTVQDTTAPTLELQPVQVYAKDKVSVEDFVLRAEDLSGEVKLTLQSQPNTDSFGVQQIAVVATDVNGNSVTVQTTLEVIRDTTPPYISGLAEILTEKNTAPDYEKGVHAWDERDGSVRVTYDASSVDLTTAGIYYVTYTATDRSGNTASSRRKVEVNHDAADTAALVASVLAEIGGNPEKIRDFVRDELRYSSDWGDSDPVWYGLKYRRGNCYVHALTLQALLQKSGYQCQIIWDLEKTHYWNLVYINGKWRHMDSTPDRWHSIYSIMDDTQRYETLSGRDWDRTLWPACE